MSSAGVGVEALVGVGVEVAEVGAVVGVVGDPAGVAVGQVGGQAGLCRVGLARPSIPDRFMLVVAEEV